MVNFHKYSVLGTWQLAKYTCGIFLKPLYFLQNLLARGNKNGIVLDLIVIYEKEGTIK